MLQVARLLNQSNARSGLAIYGKEKTDVQTWTDDALKRFPKNKANQATKSETHSERASGAGKKT
jgi:hypothetical protein